MRPFPPERRHQLAVLVDQALQATGGRLRKAAQHVAQRVPGVTEWAAVKFWYQLRDNRERNVQDPLARDSAFVRGAQRVNECRKRRHRERMASDAEYAERQRTQRKETHARCYRPYAKMRALRGPEFLFHKLVAFARLRAKRSGEMGEFEITPEALGDLWRQQGGRCAVSGLPMRPGEEAKHPLVPSLDRIDPTRGYLVDNVRFVCYFINLMKRDFEDRDVHHILSVHHQGPEQGPLPDPAKVAGKLRACLRNALRRCKERDWQTDLDIAALVDLYHRQHGRCAVSGVLMALAPLTPFSISIDRIDSSRGYSRDNAQLVCLSVNMAKLHHDQHMFAGVMDEAAREHMGGGGDHP